MNSILIKDTTREERERIVAESIGNINGACDGCAAGLAEMYQDYIDGKKEIKDIQIQPDVCDPDDVEMLQDLVMAAVNEALRMAGEATEREMSKLTGGLNMPGLF